jgi:hypothetical protein
LVQVAHAAKLWHLVKVLLPPLLWAGAVCWAAAPATASSMASTRAAPRQRVEERAMAGVFWVLGWDEDWVLVAFFFE